MVAKRVVVVDDEAHVRTILAMKLQDAGFEVDVAMDGAEALGIIADKIPDLVITDFQMPKMTGLELAQKLKAGDATAQIPILMITSRGNNLALEQMAGTNIKKIMDKPFSPRQVVSLALQMVGPSSDS